MTELPATVLEARQVTKTYPGNIQAVAGVDLSLQRGQLLALAGTSGCGKTTMLKLINRLEETSGGSILYEGEDIAALDPVMLRRSIGWVMQGDGLFPHYSVAANIAIVPRLLGWAPAAIDARVREMLELVQLDHDDFADRYPEALSGGQRQRVGFARALAGKPDLLLMDEPFGALDPITRDGLQQDFMALQARLGLSALMVTHDMAEALLLAERVLVMDAGTVVADETPHSLLAGAGGEIAQGLVAVPRAQADRLAELAR